MIKKRSGIMLCYPLEERRLINPKFQWANNFPVIVQPKLDGIRCVVEQDSKGIITQHAPFFAEDLMPVDIKIGKEVKPVPKPMPLPKNIVELVYKALVLGVRDYIEKNDHKGAIVSVSGGIDSALTLAIAVDALGKDRVEAIYSPSRYSSKLSKEII